MHKISRLILTLRPQALLFFIICIALSFYVLFYRLGTPTLDNWDEAWYADVTRNMLRTKEYVLLYWNKELFLEKPPLFIWISAISSALLGLSEFSLRLPSAFSAFLIVLGVTVFAYKKFGLLPALLAFITLLLNNVFLWRARSGNMDLLVTLFILLTFFVLQMKKRYRYILLGLLFACIYLTKLGLVLLPLAIFIVYEIIFEGKHFKKHLRDYGLLLLTMLIPVGLWLGIGYARAGTQLIDAYLIHADQGAGVIGLAYTNTHYLNHMYYALQRRFAWVFIIGVIFLIGNIRKRANFLLLAYSLILVIQLSFSGRDNNWYLIPAMPFWSMSIAYGTQQVLRIIRFNTAAATLIVLLSSFVAYKTLTINILPILSSTATAKQAESSLLLQSLSGPDETVVRLDHLYPVTIYYTDRKVLASPADSSTRTHFISRADLLDALKKRKIRWIVGKNSEAVIFLEQTKKIRTETIRVNDEEVIIKVI